MQIVKEALDSLYPAGDPKADEKIGQRLDELRASFRNLTDENREAIDYSDPLTRFAYILRYTVMHSDIVAQILRRSGRLSELFERARLRVCCLGGGPGSEVLGICKHLERSGSSCRVTCALCDREDAWADAWIDLNDLVDVAYQVNSCFIPVDAFSRASWRKHTKLAQADLITAVYFMSELYSRRQDAGPFIKHVLTAAPPEALFLYVDNNSDAFADWVDAIADECGFVEIDGGVQDARLDTNEDKMDLEPYFGRFGNPKLTANLCWKLYEWQESVS